MSQKKEQSTPFVSMAKDVIVLWPLMKGDPVSSIIELSPEARLQAQKIRMDKVRGLATFEGLSSSRGTQRLIVVRFRPRACQPSTKKEKRSSVKRL